MNLLTTKRIAERYEVKLITAQKWIQRGLFPNAIKIGRDWLIPESDLLRFKLPKIGRPKKY